MVVVTKYRRKVLVDDVKEELILIVYDLFEGKWNAKVRAVNTDLDYIHILFSTMPQTKLSALMNNLKTVSSRLLRKHHKEFLKSYNLKPVFWSDSYFIGVVSYVTDEIVELYIDSQGEKTSLTPPKSR